MADLSELFAMHESNVIDVDGIATYGLYEFPETPDNFTVEFLSGKQTPRQGVQLRAKNGSLEVNSRHASDIVLWKDAAPVSVHVAVHPFKGKDCVVRLWNVWGAGAGVTQAWLGNSAMRIADADGQDPSTVVLRCSDGNGEPDFTDLVLRLRVSASNV